MLIFLLKFSIYEVRSNVVVSFSGKVTQTCSGERNTNCTLSNAVIDFIAVLSLWTIQIQRTYAYLKEWPNNVWPQEKINFDKKIKNLVFGDKVIFQMSGPDREVAGSDRYPMAASEDEYYTDAPILGFTNINDLIRDFNHLKKRSEFQFTAIVITDEKEVIDKIRKKLGIKTPASQIDSRHILIIAE